MPLSYLNRIGEKAVQEIELRQPFRSLRDFLDRTDRRIVNKGVMLNLLWSDVFQDIGGEKTTKQLISEYYFYMATGKSRGEMTKLLEEYNKEIEPLNRFDLIKKKTESCPIFEIDYQEYFKEYFGADTVSLSKVIKLEQEYELTTAGVIGGIKVIKTKTNKTMAFASLSNSNCSIDLVLFPKTYAEYETKIKDDVLSEVKGKYSIKNNKRSIIVNSLRMIEV
jgi:DNA polymerase-3 subunit alpha